MMGASMSMAMPVAMGATDIIVSHIDGRFVSSQLVAQEEAERQFKIASEQGRACAVV